MRPNLLVAVCGLTLSGCAGMDAAACRGANWYDLGYRDGLFGIQRQDDIYEPQCARHGVQLERARYAEGWKHGDWEFQSRKRQGGTD